MTQLVAFLRGVNLGKRTVRSADLKSAFAGMGFADAKPLLASGNVLFTADGETGLAPRIEQGLKAKFGFEIGTILRTRQDLRDMMASQPFASAPRAVDAKLYVIMLGESVGERLELPFGVQGDFDVVSATRSDIFAVACKMANGRYGAGLDKIEKVFGKGVLVTTRNWNTIVKAAG